jgi:MoxR-like ATPase
VKEFVSWGAGPRASQYLILGAKARAALYGRPYATTEDVMAIASPVLRHRVITNFNAEAEGMTSDTVVRRLLEKTPRPTEPKR